MTGDRHSTRRSKLFIGIAAEAEAGRRASIYNAMPIEGVRALVDLMRTFEARHG